MADSEVGAGAFTHKHLLGIASLDRSDIELILGLASSFKEVSDRPIKKVPAMRGKTVVNLFFEPSTRTRTSFEIAAKRLSADTINVSASTSSVVKGETLLDTVRNLRAMKPDVLVIRHTAAGAPHMLASLIDTAIVNAGDGSHEHPTQALLDCLTIREKKGRVAGLTVTIVGDIAHSRVARSNVFALTKLGANVRVAGPATMIPPFMDRLGVDIYTNVKEAVSGADVVMMLRIQLERGAGMLFPSTREYSRKFGLNEDTIRLAKRDVIVMHPGPVNRGVEISPEVADGPYSVILDQVHNGVAVRMAILYLLSGREGEPEK